MPYPIMVHLDQTNGEVQGLGRGRKTMYARRKAGSTSTFLTWGLRGNDELKQEGSLPNMGWRSGKWEGTKDVGSGLCAQVLYELSVSSHRMCCKYIDNHAADITKLNICQSINWNWLHSVQ